MQPAAGIAADCMYIFLKKPFSKYSFSSFFSRKKNLRSVGIYNRQ